MLVLMRTSTPGCASWNPARRGTSHLAASDIKPLARIGELIVIWRRRVWDRAGLMQLEDRDLRDLGLSRGAAVFEASKPFWHA